MMATDIDDLVEQLLFDVAIAGSRGLGVEEVDDIIQNHYDHHQTLNSTAQFESAHATPPYTLSASSISNLAKLKAAVWQRLEGHSDITVETSEEVAVPQLDGGNDLDISDSSRISKPAPTWVYASEEQVWQTIAGHGIDRKRVPEKMFEILEVVAAAGPDGILQPDVRKVTAQDKQSVPIRTDRLADRGYISKEKVSVPKMITSRLRLWRFVKDHLEPSKDPAWSEGDVLSEFIDHLACYDGMMSLLQSNDGIAALKDIQLAIDCTSKFKRKAFARVIDRLEQRGVLRRLKAKVQNENRINGSDRFARCIQLLRDPTDLDRDAVMGKGGRLRLNEQGWPVAQSREEEDEDAVGPNLLDVAQKEVKGSDTDGAGQRDQGDLQLAAFDNVGTPSALHPPQPILSVGEQDVSATKLAQSSATPADNIPAQLLPPSRVNKPTANCSDGSSRVANSPQPLATSPSLTDAAIRSSPGVFFKPPSLEKRKVGRPRKSLVAVFKSNKLPEQSKTRTETTDDQIPPSSEGRGDQTLTNGQAPSKQLLSVNSSDGAVPPVVLSVDTTNASASALAPTPAPGSSKHQQATAKERIFTPSNYALGQRRRRERERAEKTAATQRISDSYLIHPPVYTEDVPTDESSEEEESLVAKLPMARHLLQRFKDGSSPDTATASRTLNHPATTTSRTEQGEDTGRHGPHVRLDMALIQNDQIVSPTRWTESGNDTTDQSLPERSERQPASYFNQAATGLEQNDLGGLPQIRFIPSDHNADSDAAKKWTPKKRTISNVSSAAHQERCTVVMDIVKAAGGVWPGAKKIYHPFVTNWTQVHQETPETRTVAKVVETLRRDGKLNKYEFQWQNSHGRTITFSMLMEPHIGPSSEHARRVQRKMIEAAPNLYWPKGVEISDKLRRRSRSKDTSSSRKRAADSDLMAGERNKRRRLSATQESDDEYMDDIADDDEEGNFASSTKRTNYHDNFPKVSDVTVKRTVAGLAHSTTEAQRNGFVDTEARMQAKTNLGALEYRQLRRNAMNGGELVTTDDLQRSTRGYESEEDATDHGLVSRTASPSLPSLMEVEAHPAAALVNNFPITPTRPQSSNFDAPKRRGGWPKGRPRGPRQPKNMFRLSIGGDNSALLSLLYYPRQVICNQNGTIGTFSEASVHEATSRAASSTAVDTTNSVIPRKRAADEMSADVPPITILLMGLGQTELGPSGTFGTISALGQAPEAAGTGRGKRIKKATEKAMPFSKSENTKASTIITSPTPTEKVARFSKSDLVDDPEVLVSTDYVNQHPQETWHHRGQGRWAKGLPPPGASYKTAVKGPGAAEYLAWIGTSEGKPKRHGNVVDGKQMTRNGQPWKRQPVTVNGVRIRTMDDSSTPLPNVQRPQISTASGGVPPVQYEVPPPMPAYVHEPAGSTMDGMLSSHASYPRPALGQEQHEGLTGSTQSQLSTANKRKRPYTYRSRKQLSTPGPDGVPIELDRDSDEDYRQPRSPKRQKGASQAKPSPVKGAAPIDRKRLLTAVALVKTLCAATTTHADVRWDMVSLALRMNDNGASAENQHRSMPYYPPNINFVKAVEAQMQEPFLSALEKNELPHVDLLKLEKSDWPGLLQWVEENVVPLVPKKVLNSTKKAIAASQAETKAKQAKARRSLFDVHPVFPASYGLERPDPSSDVDLNEDLIMVKSWIRANSATKDQVYDTMKATQKLSTLGTPIVQAVQEMQQSNTIRQLKKGRQRPGRNFEITQHVWIQFSKWPGEADGAAYLRSLAETRASILEHFAENDELEHAPGASEQESLILNSLVAQGIVKMEVQLPPRNDDIDAPMPKLNAWSYGGPRHDTRKLERTMFDLPVVYSKTANFSTEHSLKPDVPIPSLPESAAGEQLPRIPFWIDIHGNLIPDIWEMVLSSIIYVIVRKPGITAKGIEKAHSNKLWAWEVELALEWMERVGIAERFGTGKEVEGVWKGGWAAGEEWYYVLTPEVAVWTWEA